MKEEQKSDLIAIIGIACRFPGADDYNQFWKNLENGVNSISEIPPQRWEIEKHYSPIPNQPNKTISKWGGLVKGIDEFDAEFFSISPREAGKVDPQQRIMLELSWSCIEDAGYSPSQFSGKDVGVFMGACNYDSILLMNQNQENVEGHSGTGTWTCMIPNRISSFFNFHGPSIPIDTACSSSLVAIHYALKSLKESECEIALVGGISVLFTSTTYIQMSQLGMLSPTGQCRTFSSDADGYVRGEGAGVVLLKPLAKAIEDGDRIYAVIQGSAINHGGKARTITSPNVYSQAQVIRAAYTNANISPNTVSYIESHGTGTPLGDPIEINALKRAYRQLYQQYGVGKTEKSYCGIGAVKSNIGHLEGASGIAGFIKVLLAMKHKKLPQIVNFKELNPRISLKDTPFYLIEENQEWERLKNESGEEIPRRAGLSSFGIGGVNAHIVLEEPPEEVKNQKSEDGLERPQQILTLSAQTEKALKELAAKYQTYLQSTTEVSLQDICFSANTGRTHFTEKLAILAESNTDLQQKLADFLQGNETKGVFAGNSDSQSVAFLFTGQGSQYVEMGRQLYDTEPTFRKAIDQCSEILEKYLEVSLLDVLYPSLATKKEEVSSLIDQTAYTQPAIFALEYALAKLWESWGIKPDVVMGHSVGEYVAATVAGIFSLEDGLKLISARGRLMQQLPSGGEMVAVMASESKVESIISPYADKVAIAAINGPKSIVISGVAEAVREIVSSLESSGIKTKQLQVSHAFHSPLMEPMLAEWEAVAKELTYNQPEIAVISNVTGTVADESITTAKYWVAHVRQPVRFAQGMEALHQKGYETFLEIGPKPILLGMGRRCLPDSVGKWLPSLRPGKIPQQQSPLAKGVRGIERGKPDVAALLNGEWQQMLSSLAELYIQGSKVDWLEFDKHYSRQKVTLPTYPFQRQKYWVESSEKDVLEIYQKAKDIHPLLGHRVNNAGKQQIFESFLKAENPAYLIDHKVFEFVLFPATGYLEIATAAAKKMFANRQVTVADVAITKGLILSETEIKIVQTILTPLENNSYKFEIFSTQQEENQELPEWILHTEGKIYSSNTTQEALDLEKYQKECNQEIEIKQHYQKYQEVGLNYGSSFQGVEKLWKGKGKALAELSLPEELPITEYHLHPALLDAAVQIVCHAIATTETDQTYLPVRIEKYQLYGQIPRKVFALGEVPEDSLRAEIKLVDSQGQILAEIIGLRVMETTVSALLKGLQPDISHWYYQINWQAQPLKNSTKKQTEKWLVLAKDTQTKIVESLEEKGQECIVISPGKTYKKLAPQHYEINSNNSEEFTQILEENPDTTGIINLWGLESQQNKEQIELQTIQEQICGSILYTLQAIVKTKPKKNPRLYLVTQGTQSVVNDTEVLNPEYGSIWGLGQVISLEHPELKCKRIDCDPTAGNTEVIASVVEEILSEDPEDQIAIRQGTRYVARLEQQKQKNQGLPENQPLQLKLTEYGVIDNLNWQVMERPTPKPDEVEIQVKAVGLNFRDVLNAMGMLKEYYAEHLGVTSVEKLTFGFECAGIISAVGESVSEWQVGDEVIATILHDGFSSFITVKAEYVIAKPQKMSFTEAATLPLTFLTAYYGLEELAKIKSGDKVLIHAASGGVGQAAIQIAKQAGAEIFATASQGKWEFLRSMGIEKIFNSRTLDFAEQIKEETKGAGVDVVLNSLNGEYIDKSLGILATGGRFVEIGKIGIWSKEQFQEKRPDVSYFPFDLGEVAQQQSGIIRRMSEKLTEQWNSEKLGSLPYKAFESTEITAAFRYMQQAKHIGKVVISMPEVGSGQNSIKSEASYLITGGLGALGLEVAQWMAKQGAKCVLLTGRRNPNEKAQKIIEELEKTGTKVGVLLGDISVAADVEAIFQEIQKFPPLKGVIHAAGVLEDGLLRNLSWEQFTKVMSPKVTGTWHLHQMTKDLPLDFFVCFSSMAAMIGNAGQGNYAAANGFMDAMAHYRRGLGMPGLSINWSTWAGGGMAGSLDSQQQQQLDKSGITAIKPEQGLQALESFLSGSLSQVGVFPVKWSEFFRQTPTAEKMPLLSGFVSSQPSLSQKKSSFIEELEAKAIPERMDLLTKHIRSMLAQTLGIKDGQKIGMREPFFDIGLDSLMAVELKNRMESSLNVSLSSTLLFDYPVLEKLISHLADDVIPIDFSIENGQTEKDVELETDGSSTEDDSSRFQEMSEDDVVDLLAKKLESLGG